MSASPPKLSICIPVYNGAATIAALVDTCVATLREHYALEFVLVDDYSRDASDAVCKELAARHDFVKYISLRRNFGEHNAVMCALNYATGDFAVIIDDDFQNPPSEIRALVEEARKGYDVVYSRYADKQHGFFRNLGSRFNDRVANWLLEKPPGLYLSSFKVISADMVKRLIRYQGPSPYIDGLVLRETGNISSVLVAHAARQNGQSNYTLAKLVALWLNMFINFSIKPLRLFALFGVVVTLVSFVAAVAFIIQKLLNPTMQVGWTSVMVSILFFAGVQIIFLGLIGEYVGKHYLHSNGTPQWVVKEEHL
ncbi:MAG: glycosyltransferase family 2 protein [Pseudomonadota bacterium]|nr:glycosyltransferase family 2 protein [Pseudomonadota bacterium]